MLKAVIFVCLHSFIDDLCRLLNLFYIDFWLDCDRPKFFLEPLGEIQMTSFLSPHCSFSSCWCLFLSTVVQVVQEAVCLKRQWKISHGLNFSLRLYTGPNSKLLWRKPPIMTHTLLHTQIPWCTLFSPQRLPKNERMRWLRQTDGAL